jgi:hypothetical protein
MTNVSKLARLPRSISITLVAGLLASAGCQRNEEDRYARAGPGEELIAKAAKQGGRIDNWIVRGTNGIPHRWVRDENGGGKADSWSFFKDGKAFLDEFDSDHNGKVDTIHLHVLSEDKTRIREFLFTLDDREKNIFTEHEDTGWQELQKQEK